MTAGRLRVVVVEDRPSDVELVAAALRRDGLAVQVIPVCSYAELADALAVRPDVVLTDHHVPGMSIAQVLRTVRTGAPGVPVLVVTGALDDDTAMEMFEQGVSDVLLKDRLARLGPAVRSALENARLHDAVVVSRAERARMEDLLTGLLRHSPAAIGLLDGRGREVFANARFEALAGDDATRERMTATPSGGELRHGRDTYLVTRFAVDDVVGGPPTEGFVLADVTGLKAVEDALRTTQAELRAQSEELRRQNAELRELDRLRTELVSTVSHELRTPLTSILGFAELAEDHLTERADGAGLEMVAMLRRNGERLLTLVDNLLVLAAEDQRRTTSTEPDATAPVDVDRLVADACAVLQPLAARRDVSMTFTAGEDLPPVCGDPGRLERVLLNVGSNAVKFAAQGGRVTWRTACEDGQVVVRVEDDGEGISPQDLERVGARFFRTETARSRHVPGTGLGLAVVRAILDDHAGALELTSAPGRGTCATVRLPATQPARQAVP